MPRRCGRFLFHSLLFARDGRKSSEERRGETLADRGGTDPRSRASRNASADASPSIPRAFPASFVRQNLLRTTILEFQSDFRATPRPRRLASRRLRTPAHLNPIAVSLLNATTLIVFSFALFRATLSYFLSLSLSLNDTLQTSNQCSCDTYMQPLCCYIPLQSIIQTRRTQHKRHEDTPRRSYTKPNSESIDGQACSFMR